MRTVNVLRRTLQDMHIGINAQLLSFSQSYRNGGVSRYIRYLLTALAEQPGQHEYIVFVNGQEVIERLPRHPQIMYIPASWPESFPVSRVIWEQLSLPSWLHKIRFRVFHSPVNVLPERVPPDCATVVTLHDLAFLHFPHVLTPPKRLYHRAFTIRSLRRATALITVSESTKQDAHRLVDIPIERIYTVYPCIDQRFTRSFSEEDANAFRERQGLNTGFVLYLGTLEPRKNIPTLIDAYALLRERYNRQEKLVLAGGKGWLYESIYHKVRELGLEQEVIFPGFVPDEEQALWYRAASVFAYPSLYEGFGFPVAEALACGTPVVTSNVSSLPEAGAQLALCVDPYNTAALAAALNRALTDPAIRTGCRVKAPLVAQQFSASRMAEQTRGVYERADEALQEKYRFHRELKVAK
jgi:glycosyltransferase involved in cell wall biosynthesis